MKDKWMNVGYEDDELKPHQEPSKDCTDPVRVGSYHAAIISLLSTSSKLYVFKSRLKMYFFRKAFD